MLFWLIAVAVALLLFAAAWWTSGRARGKVGRPDPAAEIARGRAIEQAVINRETNGMGGSGI